MVRRLLPVLSIAAALAVPITASADTLLIEGLRAAASSTADRPKRGMTMDRVAATWGEPAMRGGPVGDPPISRWEYDGFVVFFEYSHVIHAVRN